MKFNLQVNVISLPVPLWAAEHVLCPNLQVRQVYRVTSRD